MRGPWQDEVVPVEVAREQWRMLGNNGYRAVTQSCNQTAQVCLDGRRFGQARFVHR